MNTEEELREKLRKIEALFSKGATDGEKNAANAAKERIRDRLNAINRTEKSMEVRISISDPWSRKLFTALCRRYGIEPYRYTRQRLATVMIRVPESFLDNILWPEYKALSSALTEHLTSITEKIISEEIHANSKSATVVEEVLQLS